MSSRYYYAATSVYVSLGLNEIVGMGVVVAAVVSLPIIIYVVCTGNKAKGPPLPPPSILRRLRNNQLVVGSIYGNMVAIQTHPDGARVLTNLYQQVDTLGLNLIDNPTVCEYFQDGVHIWDKGYKHHNENNLPGWTVYMERLKVVYNLSHLWLYSKACNRSGWTEGFKLPSHEISGVERVFRDFGLPTSIKEIALKGTKYEVNAQLATPTLFYACQKEEANPPRATHYRPAPPTGQVTWACKIGEYLIVIVAHNGVEDLCKRIALELMQYVNAIVTSEYGMTPYVKDMPKVQSNQIAPSN